MHAFIFLVLMTPSSGGGIWDVTPMPNIGVQRQTGTGLRV
uniref:Uncharacterized protein n=1 Tax=Klebsiella pneumoniae TaxID=573 RepID=A0A486SZB5_KLEPN|nr:Uncharacterised protein [Klebsiella pneumoniae]